ncbi:hypothetical protein D3C80_164520 [compost metagenome]
MLTTIEHPVILLGAYLKRADLYHLGARRDLQPARHPLRLRRLSLARDDLFLCRCLSAATGPCEVCSLLAPLSQDHGCRLLQHFGDIGIPLPGEKRDNVEYSEESVVNGDRSLFADGGHDVARIHWLIVHLQ